MSVGVTFEPCCLRNAERCRCTTRTFTSSPTRSTTRRGGYSCPTTQVRVVINPALLSPSDADATWIVICALKATGCAALGSSDIRRLTRRGGLSVRFVGRCP